MILIATFLCGIILLIFGTEILSKTLEKISAGIIKTILYKLTKNTFMGFVFGTIVTAIVQSSTAVTIITVSLVNSRIIDFRQALGIIYGSNLGTTITAQIMSLDISKYSFHILLLGIIVHLLSRSNPIKFMGKSIMGFALIFMGLEVLQLGGHLMKNNIIISQLIGKYASSPFFSFLIGIIITSIIQSSSATVGVTMVLFKEGIISFPSAIAFTLGSNIGTCAAALIACIPGNIHARRTAWAHTLYNIIGSVSAMLFLNPFSHLIEYVTFNLLNLDVSFLIANVHTIFNILSALVFLPMTSIFARFIEKLIHEKK